MFNIFLFNFFAAVNLPRLMAAVQEKKELWQSSAWVRVQWLVRARETEQLVHPIISHKQIATRYRHTDLNYKLTKTAKSAPSQWSHRSPALISWLSAFSRLWSASEDSDDAVVVDRRQQTGFNEEKYTPPLVFSFHLLVKCYHLGKNSRRLISIIDSLSVSFSE